jgi:hypothetical protein
MPYWLTMIVQLTTVFDIVVLNSTRDVLKIKQKPNPVTQPKEALVIGNICFNSALDRVVKSNIKIHGSSPTI